MDFKDIDDTLVFYYDNLKEMQIKKKNKLKQIMPTCINVSKIQIQVCFQQMDIITRLKAQKVYFAWYILF